MAETHANDAAAAVRNQLPTPTTHYTNSKA